MSEESFGSGSRATILVVDDEQVIADTLVMILNQSGFSASAAYSAMDALEILDMKVPDVLITDVSMPGMTGVELAITTRDRWPSCKILLFSGHAATSSLIEDAHRRGYHFAFLNKPVHPRDLLHQLMAA